MATKGLRKIKLKEVCERITVGHVGPMADKYTAEGIPFLRSQNINAFRLSLDDIKFIPPEFHYQLRKSALRAGDVAVVRTGYPGTACVIPNIFTELNCADLVVITPSKELNPHYLAAIFNSAWGVASVAGNLVGVAQQHFNIGAAREMEVSLPPRALQDRIAGILSAYDELIENSQRRIKILEEMARAFYREWFVHFRFPGHESVPRVQSPLGDIPKGWVVKRLETICEKIISGGTPRTSANEYWGGEIPWLSSGETGNAFIIETDKKITEEGVSNSSTRFARSGCTVVASAGQGKTRGQTSMLCLNCFINQSIIALTADSKQISDNFLFLDLSGRYSQLRQISDGSSRGSLTTRLLAELEVIVPPASVVHEFDVLVAPIVKSIEIGLRKNKNLHRTRDLLLPRLLSGQIDVEAIAS